MSHPKHKFSSPYPSSDEFEFAQRFDAHMAAQPKPANSFGAAMLVAAALLIGIAIASVDRRPVPAPAPAVEAEHLTSAWTGTVVTRRAK